MTGIDLDHLRIANPCPASWSSMTGNERARFCGDCRKHVYNLAELTRQEAVELIQTHQGKVCMRIHRRVDGTVLVGDCPVGWRAMRGRMAKAAALLLGWITAAFAGIGCDTKRVEGTPPSGERDPVEVMGDVCVEPPLVNQPEDLPVLMGEVCPDSPPAARDALTPEVR